jgi:hypothetical protein
MAGQKAMTTIAMADLVSRLEYFLAGRQSWGEAVKVLG